MGQSYRDLIAWQKSLEFVADVYRTTEGFPQKEIYTLTSQLRRAAISIPSNIAEGQGRLTSGEFRQFLGHARGSTLEVETQILIANKLGYLGSGATQKLLSSSAEIGRLIDGLLASL